MLPSPDGLPRPAGLAPGGRKTLIGGCGPAATARRGRRSPAGVGIRRRRGFDDLDRGYALRSWIWNKLNATGNEEKKHFPLKNGMQLKGNGANFPMKCFCQPKFLFPL